MKRLIGMVGRRPRLDAVVGRIRNAVGGLHPEAVELVVEHGDLVEVLDPIGAVIAGHDEAERKAVEDGQILAVHAIGQHHLAVAGVIDVERLGEIRRRVHHRAVEAAEHHLLGASLHAGHIEHGLERYAMPARTSHGAVAELAAGDAWGEEAAAVAGALIDGDELGRLQLADILQRQGQRLVDLALYLQRELVGVDVERDAGEVIAHEERVVRRDRAIVEDGEGRLELRRPTGQADHRPLLRIGHDGPFAIVERQRQRVGERARRGKSRGQRGHTGALHQFSSVDHMASSEASWSEPVITGLEAGSGAWRMAQVKYCFGRKRMQCTSANKNPGRLSRWPGFPDRARAGSVARIDDATVRGHHDAGVNDRAAEAVAEAMETPVMTPAAAKAEAMCGRRGRRESGSAD